MVNSVNRETHISKERERKYKERNGNIREREREREREKRRKGRKISRCQDGKKEREGESKQSS